MDGKHYDSNKTYAPVATEAIIHIVMILWIMVIVWIAELIDMKGAFLHGDFEKGRQV